MKNDPDSLACPAGTVDVLIEMMVRFPIPPEEIERFKEVIGAAKPKRPHAFVLGHGLWNVSWRRPPSGPQRDPY